MFVQTHTARQQDDTMWLATVWGVGGQNLFRNFWGPTPLRNSRLQGVASWWRILWGRSGMRVGQFVCTLFGRSSPRWLVGCGGRDAGVGVGWPLAWRWREGGGEERMETQPAWHDQTWPETLHGRGRHAAMRWVTCNSVQHGASRYLSAGKQHNGECWERLPLSDGCPYVGSIEVWENDRCLVFCLLCMKPVCSGICKAVRLDPRAGWE